MDIKLRARLSAYSKIESVDGVNSNVPAPDATAAGNVLGVNNSGKYTLFPTVSTAEINALFTDIIPDEVVTKDDIDTLFEPDDEEPEISTVSYADIDSLFK